MAVARQGPDAAAIAPDERNDGRSFRHVIEGLELGLLVLRRDGHAPCHSGDADDDERQADDGKGPGRREIGFVAEAD